MQLLAFSALLTFLPAVFSVDCTSNPDGTYDQGCREFIVCRGHVANLITCKYQTVFNSNTGKCDDPKNVPPPCGVQKNCTNLPDGSYPDYDEHCRTYYTCHGGTFFGHNFCTPGTVFSEVLLTCDWPNDVPPPCGTKRV